MKRDDDYKDLMIDEKGAMRTQSLFLEIGYNYDVALFTLKDRDYEAKGKLFKSLKLLYLAEEDVIEYGFANTHLLGWGHWQRMCNNKQLTPHINDWREELELKLRSQAVRDIIDASAEEKGFQALKWLADKGWGKRSAGRPTKDATDHNKRMKEKLDGEFGADVVRMNDRRK